jgi:uncharacterized YccA/Bax inhibitor family protein
MMRTANPALNANTFEQLALTGDPSRTMTIQGTVNKTILSLALLVIAAGWTWHLFFEFQDVAAIQPWLWGGLIGGLIVGIATVFKKTWAPVTTPIYAVLQGLVLGGISALFESRFPGIVIQAVGLTFGTLAALLVAYTSRLIKVTENFKLGVAAATGGIFVMYLLSFFLGFAGINVPFIHGSGLFGIGFSMFVVVIAALNLVLDFDFIEQGAERGAPKYMEWYAAFGLLVTLIWLYLEILRLLAKLQSRK